MPRSVYVHQRLRPLRMAFFVSPDDPAALRRVLEVNTCIWGGMFNPIVPLFSTTPAWWDTTGGSAPPPQEIVAGYVRAFEPDYFVFADKSGAAGHGFDEHRVLALDDVLTPEGEVEYGISAMDRYRHLWKEEFRFVQKQEPKVLLASAAVASHADLVAACCGAFPAGKAAYFEDGYREGFTPKAASLSAADLLDVQIDRGVGTPLRFGASGIGGPYGRRPTIFVLDPAQTYDVIDYWNLRVSGRRVIAVPMDAADAVKEVCGKFIAEHHEPTEDGSGSRRWTDLIKARSVDRDRFMAWCDSLDGATRDGASVQVWYPKIWDAAERYIDEVHPPELRAADKRTECAVDDGMITFEPLEPPFEVQHDVGKPRWAEIVELRDYGGRGDVAVMFPRQLADISAVLQAHEMPWEMAATSEGIVLRRHSAISPYRWKLPTGQEVARRWLKARRLDASTSDAGTTATEMLRAIGGPFGARQLAHAELITSLDALAHGEVVEADVAQPEPGERRARQRHESTGQFWQRLLGLNCGNVDRTKRHLGWLLEFGALRVGLVLNCSKCHQTNWFAVGDLRDDLPCARCLQTFPFPASKPPTAWAFRVQGPFAVENYAQGAYTIALVLRFLTSTLHAEATWTVGVELKGTFASAGKRELDLLAWWRESRFDAEEPWLVLGECKSFTASFEPTFGEIVAAVNPRGRLILLFATLDETLVEAERKKIADTVAQIRTTTPRALVLVLTARELLSNDFPECWKDLGAPYGRWAEQGVVSNGMEGICKATERLYLSEPKPDEAR